MTAHRSLLAFGLALPLALATESFTDTAAAQDPDEYGDLDLDGDDSKKKKKKAKKTRQARDLSGEPVKEITRGVYAKASVGAAAYLLDFAGFINAGTSTGLSVGKDFVDQERVSVAGEVLFLQGIHNGCYYEFQIEGLCPKAPGQIGPLIQGDLRTYTFAAVAEVSGYPSRRFGVGFRAGGGILFSPLLMDEQFYLTRVVGETWGGQQGGYHDAPHPMVMAGPTFEYYTKLSHFSIGADIDAMYVVNFDLGVSGTAYLTYTF